MKIPYRLRSMIIGLSTMLLVVVAFGQSRPAKPTKPAAATPNVEAPVGYSGVKYQAENRRDPFLSPINTKKNSGPVDEVEGRGQPPPGIAGTLIAQAALLGISRSTDGQTAVFRGADKRAYFLQEGDRLFDGYLKKIESDSVLMVRETRFRSGKTLTEQIVKKLRTP